MQGQTAQIRSILCEKALVSAQGSDRGMSASSAAEQQDELEQLLARYQQGDRGAASALITLASPALLRYCRSQGDPLQEAEDLLQEIWLRVHRARHTYRAGERAMPWLYAIARHTRIDAYRRRRRLKVRELPLDPLADRAAPAASRDDSAGFVAMLNELPPGEREVLTMLKGLGMSLEEVARATATTVGAVKQRAHRAYERLRRAMAAAPREDRP